MRKVTFNVFIPERNDFRRLWRRVSHFCFDSRPNLEVAVPKDLEVVDARRIPYEKALYGCDEAEAKQVVGEAIRTWVSEGGLDCPVSLVLPSEGVFSREESFPSYPFERYDLYAGRLVREAFDSPLKSLEWRLIKRESPLGIAERGGLSVCLVRLILMAIRKSALEEAIKPFQTRVLKSRLDCVTSRHLTMLEYHSAYAGFLKDPYAHMILDMHAKTTDLHFISERSSLLLSIPCGGRSFTHGLMRDHGYTFDQAEDHKLHVMQREHPRRAFGAMRCNFEDLIREIDRRLAFFSERNRGVGIGQITLAGNAASLPGLCRFLASRLSRKISVLEPSECITITDPLQEKLFKDDFANFLHPYMAAVQRLGFGHFRQNLLSLGAPLRRQAKIAWGVDVGSHGLTAVKVRRKMH